jgi:hypothetical protein
MLYIPLYTASLLGISWSIPSIIPTFKNQYNQIYSAIKSNVIFTHECVNEIHQKQLDVLDKMISHLMNCICQLVIVGWSVYNLTLYDSLETLNEFIIGFYLYDIIRTLTKNYGKTQGLFLVHHVLSIVLLLYKTFAITDFNNYLSIIYVLLEFSGASLNLTHIIRFVNPASKYTITVSGINVNIYFITRCVFYPVNLMVVSYDIYHRDMDILSKYLCIPALSLLWLLFGMSAWWLVVLVKKHEETRKKWLL